jgi:cytochrome c oxidase assembly factor CtaG
MPYFQTAQPVIEPADSFGDLVSRWDVLDPLALLVLVFAAVYVTGLARLTARVGTLPVPASRVYSALGGLTILFVALAGPFDGFATEVFWLHMIQHLLIALIAVPLLLLASPMPVYLWAMPETVRLGAAELLSSKGPVRTVLARLTYPWVAAPLYIFTLYIWHFPPAFTAALDNPYIHYAQHFSFFVTAALFWWPLIGPAPVRSKLSYPQRMVYLLMVVTPSAFLGAVVTLTGHVIYDGYLDSPGHWGMTPLEDQQMAGVLLWVPGNVVYLATLTALFFKWAAKEEKKAYTARPPQPGVRPRQPPSPRGGTLQKRQDGR